MYAPDTAESIRGECRRGPSSARTEYKVRGGELQAFSRRKTASGDSERPTRSGAELVSTSPLRAAGTGVMEVKRVQSRRH
jgi:hypothetical protein